MSKDLHNRQIRQHLEAIRSLEAEQAAVQSDWPPKGAYPLWHVGVGMILGTLGATLSLLANGLAAPMFGQRPLELIRVYLTFPMGQKALELDSGTVLFTGCVLYLITGALYGILLHVILAIFFDQESKAKRFFIASAVGLGLWVLNFYLILSWLQPLLLGGNWIVRMVPPWVGCMTHLVFAWSVAAAELLGWGHFEPPTISQPATSGRSTSE
jgi:hypothetical protein